MTGTMKIARRTRLAAQTNLVTLYKTLGGGAAS